MKVSIFALALAVHGFAGQNQRIASAPPHANPHTGPALQGLVGSGPYDAPTFEPCDDSQEECGPYDVLGFTTVQNLFPTAASMAYYYTNFQIGRLRGTAVTTFRLYEAGKVVYRQNGRPYKIRPYRADMAAAGAPLPASYTGPAHLVISTVVTSEKGRAVTLSAGATLDVQPQDAAVPAAPRSGTVSSPQPHVRVIASPAPFMLTASSVLQGLIASGSPDTSQGVPCLYPMGNCSKMPQYGVQAAMNQFPFQGTPVTHCTTLQTANLSGSAVSTFTLKEGGNVVDQFTANPVDIQPNTSYLVSYDSNIPSGYTGPATLKIQTVVTTSTNQTVTLSKSLNLVVLQ